MHKIITKYLKSLSIFLINNFQDMLIFLGIGIFIFTMFRFISLFAGYLSLSIVLIVLGILISKIKS
ncbi:hypothetical protein ACFO6R_05975 [Eubacterium multiforme]|uniref:Uncharacterized protein n=1 Tax=Eubacterium multiforme TaxID=83339 RepID=A0ABT9US36_9FIRM|nr:hypothetical protein [Eubacterium multiforme]MDQ0149132.1 hypothetical protein [Eubacterium multiforme]